MQLDTMCLKVAHIATAYARIGLTGIVFTIITNKRRENAGAFTLQVSTDKSNQVLLIINALFSFCFQNIITKFPKI